MAGEGPLLLALDSSTETAGIALYDGSRFSELTWNAGRTQTVSLLPELERLLALNARGLRDVGAIGVAIGPGSFNGLRVGMSVAKGLCYGLGLPIVGVATLDAVAYPHVGTRAPIRAFVLAGRGRAVYADYRHRNGRWVRTSDLRNERAEALVTGLTERTMVAGEMPERLAEVFQSNRLAVVPPPALRARRPSYLAEIAFRRWQAGDTDDLDLLEPIYVHGQAVTEERAAAASGTD